MEPPSETPEDRVKAPPPGQKPPFSLSPQTVSLVQGIVGKPHERQVDCDKRQYNISWYGIIGFNVPLNTYRSFWDDFTGQMTQPTVS